MKRPLFNFKRRIWKVANFTVDKNIIKTNVSHEHMRSTNALKVNAFMLSKS
jgi:hypothetical protein